MFLVADAEHIAFGVFHDGPHEFTDQAATVLTGPLRPKPPNQLRQISRFSAIKSTWILFLPGVRSGTNWKPSRGVESRMTKDPS